MTPFFSKLLSLRPHRSSQFNRKLPKLEILRLLKTLVLTFPQSEDGMVSGQIQYSKMLPEGMNFPRDNPANSGNTKLTRVFQLPLFFHRFLPRPSGPFHLPTRPLNTGRCQLEAHLQDCIFARK